MREKRIKSNDAELDRKEMEWWDANAEIIEKIWALNFDFQKLIRLPYLKKAKHFFITNSANKPLNILEVGCGTGWVGRMIADENLHITGTDFSEAQLKIAKEEAKRFNKEDFCKYQLASSTIVSKDLDGIILHAILHHFTEEELMTFFNELEKIF